MSISLTLLEYLEWETVDYELLQHEPAFDSMHTAESAHIPGDQLAKCVVLEDENGYLMAVIPATHELELETLNKQLNRQLQFASEDEIADLYEDCDRGAAPPLPPGRSVRGKLASSYLLLPVYCQLPVPGIWHGCPRLLWCKCAASLQ